MNTKIQKRIRRHKRVRAKIIGTAKIPRLCVFKSNTHIYAQLIDDAKHLVLAQANDLKLKKEKKTDLATKVGQEIAKLATDKKINTVVFDRGGFKYHGRIKALAEGARSSGLKF
jgi:large subunit ribosomal protein L18